MYSLYTVKIMSFFLHRYRYIVTVIDRSIPLPTVTHRYCNVTHRCLSFFHRFVQLFLLPEFFGNKKSEKNIKNTKQSKKTNNEYTASVFGASYGHFHDPLAILMRRYLNLT